MHYHKLNCHPCLDFQKKGQTVHKTATERQTAKRGGKRIGIRQYRYTERKIFVFNSEMKQKLFFGTYIFRDYI